MAAQVQQYCFFKSLGWLCGDDSKEKLIIAQQTRIANIIASSKVIGDGLHVELEAELNDNNNDRIMCHKDCVSTYTSKYHIKRIKGNDQSESNAPPQKRMCRSDLPVFDFRRDCIFCGKCCQIQPDARHPDRWLRVIRCRTAEHGYGKKDFKNAILVRGPQARFFSDHALSAIKFLTSSLDNYMSLVYETTCWTFWNSCETFL